VGAMVPTPAAPARADHDVPNGRGQNPSRRTPQRPPGHHRRVRVGEVPATRGEMRTNNEGEAIRACRRHLAYRLCGAKGIRTPDLLHAMQALYQLSYSPVVPEVFDLSATRLANE
jgi:hypothetical protein